jgi:mono/diheme cytochrome c family protein
MTELDMRFSSALVLNAFAALIGAAVAAQEPVVGNASNGKQLFEKDGCYECHGYAAQGGRDGARLAATAMNAQSFSRYVRRPSGSMPAFTVKVLSDQELLDVYAYVKGLSAATPATDIPLLNQLRKN